MSNLQDRAMAKVFSVLLMFSVLSFLAPDSLWAAGKCYSSARAGAAAQPMGTAAVDQDYGHRIGGVLFNTIEHADLQILWSSKVPLGRTKGIKMLFHHDDRIYVVDNSNVLYAFAANSGQFYWATDLAESEPSCSLPFYYDGHMLFVLGNDVVEVRESDGSLTLENQRLTLDFPVSTTVVRTEEFVLAGGTDRRFYCMRLPYAVPVWQSVSDDEPVGTVAQADDMVYFGCKDGSVFVSEVARRHLVWRFKAQGLVPGVVVDRGQCFVPSEDTALYALDARTGKPLWKFLTGGRLSEVPVVTETLVYQPRWQGGMVCINRADGTERWDLPDVEAFLAEYGAYAYVRTLKNELLRVNQQNGQGEVSFLLKDFDLCTANIADEKIFLATSQGLLAVLQPRGAEGN